MRRKLLTALLSGLMIAGFALTGAHAADKKAANKGKFEKVSQQLANQKGCLSCHEGISTIREEGSEMLRQIRDLGKEAGDPEGCVVCHGGNPKATTKAEAHKGAPKDLGPKMFYKDPGSVWIAENTCGQCHADYAYRLERSLMNTEAGKLQGNLHTFGIEEVQNHKVPWGNYDVKDTDGREPQVGTDAYKKYMASMIKNFPDQLPAELKMVPLPSVEEIEKKPELSGFTYSRQQCQRCHVGVKGREKRGDYRGMGCSACHIPYGNEGIYEGKDPTIDKTQKGHMLVHRIQGTREAKVEVNGLTYSGIPVESCNHCHNRGKRIGVTYQGLMEFPYGSPWNAMGKKQPKLHTKKYLFIADDLHHQIKSRPENPKGGMLCQDCHTTIDMHGDGNIFGTTLAQVEIECQDCHGTTKKYPWELPLGYSEEFGKEIPQTPRGLAKEQLMETETFATKYDAKDGFLLTARGNPFGNVVKDGDKVILHSATGLDFFVPILKDIKKKGTWKSLDAEVAMDKVAKHNDNLECYACHASWVPQCYGCHVKTDYSKGKMDTDWVANGNTHGPDGQTKESPLGTHGLKSPGKVMETRSYLRWEDPVLGINGEGRVTPLMPGCQVIYTVIGRDGKVIVNNKIAVSKDEQAELGQERTPLAIDMAPVQPHSMQRKARTCESCHNNPKAMGYGIGGGLFMAKYTKDIIEELIDQRTGKPIPKNYKVQSQAIPQLDFDLSTIIKDGQQTQTVGTHWPLSRSLPKKVRDAMERTGLCMGCHREMSNAELWKKVSTPGSLTDKQHMEMLNKMLKTYAASKK